MRASRRRRRAWSPTRFAACGVGRATNLLQFSDKKAAHLIKKVLLSAVANAENNLGADVDELKVATIMVDEGPSLKRMHARAKGRGSRILKRTSHITVVVGEANGTETTMGHKVHPTGIRLGIAKDWNFEVVRQQARVRRATSPPISRSASC